MSFRNPGWAVVFGAAVSLSAALAATPQRAEAEPASCLSSDPAQWPASSKPYFMIIVDSSGSMTSSVSTSNSCGYPNNRLGHARCAVRNTINAYSGEVNFGLATYAWRETGCSGAACYTGCSAQYTAADDNACGPLLPEGTLGATNVHYGANIIVPMLQDHYWSQPPDPSNVGSMLGYVDNNCTGSIEIGASSNTPLGGALLNMNQYFSGTFQDPFSGTTLASPIGTLAQGERSCRPLNVILITDGDETCDNGVSPTPIANGCRNGQAAYLNSSGERLASYEADRMFTNGITIGGQNFKVRTHVIGFAGATTASLDHIAACGGTTASYSTANEAAMSQALSTIIGSAVAPETCDNTDNNCNGCTDEGYLHYGDQGQTCCAWTTDPQRNTCLANYVATITPANPTGNLALLPCTTVGTVLPAQQADPAHWLCYNPGDICDGVDNNGQFGVDEGQTKCGSPLHCPTPEVCNGVDDNCNGSIDEGGVCGSCVNSPEVCDGCDNDCNGIADDGIAPVACGLASPANCAGTKTCLTAGVAVPIGGCVSGGGFSACSNNPQPETCDGIDNNCNGIIDDGIAPVQCVPNGTPNNLVYGGTSQCKKGTQPCMGTCTGFVGPSAEICDGIDNDCNGIVDDMPFGVGTACGPNTPPCSPGLVACVAGVLTCQGGVQPTSEICDGIDNNCNGQTDEAPLADAPPPGQSGCWSLAGNACSHGNLHWSPPPGANCSNVGTLSAPCNTGTLVCAGAQGWKCQGGTLPTPEVCDGVDNNCNSTIDEGPFPGDGQVCGSSVGECKTGIQNCVGGAVTCVGSVGPTPEICDGKDNDCNGVVDNGIPTGGPCQPTYDMVAYPGPRTAAPCQPGVLQCDGNGGLICVGGVGPSPELCDGVDNDCDGAVDETSPGMGPDVITGSANPFPPPAGNIGDACGTNVGTCTQGNYACVNGTFSCLGGTSATVETCDCKDNDCNGTIDNENPNNNPPLCSSGKSCVHSATQGCQCAVPCSNGEFPCPSGQVCETITMKDGAEVVGNFCVTSTCPDCTIQTVKDSNGKILCAPAGTPSADCSTIPVCECKGQNGCQAPCFGVSCSAPQVCTNFGPNAGKCVQDNCFNVPCQGCGEVCDNEGSCKQNPCSPNPCQPNQVCKPTMDFTDHVCVGSCAGVMCGNGTTCVDGQCVPTCTPACDVGKVCDMSQNPPACVDDMCSMGPTCTNGACCDPVSGQCGACSCTGVVCPSGQKCLNDQCVDDAMGTGGAGSSSSSSASSGSSGSGAGGEGTGGGAHSNGVFGLATGGGGCACEVSGTSSTGTRDFGLAAVALGAVVSRMRRRRERARAAGEEVSR